MDAAVIDNRVVAVPGAHVPAAFLPRVPVATFGAALMAVTAVLSLFKGVSFGNHMRGLQAGSSEHWFPIWEPVAMAPDPVPPPSRCIPGPTVTILESTEVPADFVAEPTPGSSAPSAAIGHGSRAAMRSAWPTASMLIMLSFLLAIPGFAFVVRFVYMELSSWESIDFDCTGLIPPPAFDPYTRLARQTFIVNLFSYEPELAPVATTCRTFITTLFDYEPEATPVAIPKEEPSAPTETDLQEESLALTEAPTEETTFLDAEASLEEAPQEEAAPVAIQMEEPSATTETDLQEESLALAEAPTEEMTSSVAEASPEEAPAVEMAETETAVSESKKDEDRDADNEAEIPSKKQRKRLRKRQTKALSESTEEEALPTSELTKEETPLTPSESAKEESMAPSESTISEPMAPSEPTKEESMAPSESTGEEKPLPEAEGAEKKKRATRGKRGSGSNKKRKEWMDKMVARKGANPPPPAPPASSS
jgi:hypothetical protein